MGAEPAGATTEEKHGYFAVSRSISASFLAALPLLVIYEAGVLLLARDTNLAAVWVKSPLTWLREHPQSVLGPHVMLVVNFTLIVAAVVAGVRVHRKGGLHAGTFGGMLAESAFYALLLGPALVLLMTGRLAWTGFEPKMGGFAAKLIASCGAGVYEELFFRAALLGSLYVLAREAAGLRPFVAGLAALAVSGAIFSAAHLLNPGEEVSFGAFVFRLLAGMALGVIFLVRGFGVAAWTHALYDLYVLCCMAA